MKKELLMTTLKGPAIPLAKGIDGRRFVGAQSWPGDQEDAAIATCELVPVQKLAENLDLLIRPNNPTNLHSKLIKEPKEILPCLPSNLTRLPQFQASSLK